MAGFCPAPAPDIGLVQGLLSSVDCNVRVMAEAGYGALAQPGSSFGPALTAILTLYIAILGFGMLMGRTPLRVGDLTITVLKIGAVLALATNWPTYQRVVFDTLFLGPEQLATSMLNAIQPPGSDLRGNPFDGLQLAYDELQRSATYFTQRSLSLASPLQGGNAGAAFGLTLASTLMLLMSLGAVLAAKIVLGLLLALGPVFIALLMFDSTRGVFEGWLRAAVAFALTPLLATLALIVQLVMIEPHLVRLVEMRAQGVVDVAPANAILLLTLISTGVALSLGIATAMVATGFRLPWRTVVAAEAGRQGAAAMSNERREATAVTVPGSSAPPRAAAVAGAVAAMERRESRLELVSTDGPRRTSVGRGRDELPGAAERAPPLGQTYRRAAQPRRAASNVRRDR
ncbi:type IV secretion system protein [Phenylobacterium sp.]|uniref:type IV secretion system protein n=1 Tax=Phenylobacterium sp. TaxID=1871053 RepID=UPI00286E018C|nr:type IV secretion system protein [Phenylobacterium sp.]